MNEHYENIKNKSTCSECGSNKMAIFYMWEGSGIVQKQWKGPGSYIGAGNVLLIACTSCGYVEKTFLIGK